jgi:hypothetical protein
MRFPIDEIERRFTPDDSPALTRLQAKIAYQIAAVEDEVERWGHSFCRGPLLGDEAAESYLQAETVLDRLRGMDLGWWQRHVRDSVADLLALAPCPGPDCRGLRTREEGDRCAVCRDFGHLTAAQVEAGNRRVWEGLKNG